MRRLVVFNHVSLDGYFTDANGDMSFAQNPAQDARWDEFVESNASGDGELLFGRVTYDMMASFWPTPIAAEHMPHMAERMNRYPKIVFSRTLEQVDWNNTRLVKDNLVESVRRLKTEPGPDLLIFGSGTIVSQLAQADLIDEYQVVLNPVILGAGRTMFTGLPGNQPLKLKQARAFDNGNVWLCYERAG
ncbi:MAG TPA: dihydrofolate reductase family protein [Anaerolineaceae bacterium]